MKKQKSKKTTVVAVFVFIVGLSLMLYPTVSNLWNQHYASKVIADYDSSLQAKSEEEYEVLFRAALDYNKERTKGAFVHTLTQREQTYYNVLLNITGTGMMGYIEIPSLDVKLPIYHGTDEAVLQDSAGHLEWSSLPVGGTTSHCVISGHRGLPSAKLFTDLDELIEGDYFSLKVLNQTLWYEVDKISIVEPNELDALVLTKGQDYVTLVTCTPYGINTHRLLVRGHRITDAALEKVLQVTADATVISPILVSVILFVPFSCVGLLFPFALSSAKKRRFKKSKSV